MSQVQAQEQQQVVTPTPVSETTGQQTTQTPEQTPIQTQTPTSPAVPAGFVIPPELAKQLGLKDTDDFNAFLQVAPAAVQKVAEQTKEERRQAALRERTNQQEADRAAFREAFNSRLAKGEDGADILYDLLTGVQSQILSTVRPDELKGKISEEVAYHNFWANPQNADLRDNPKAAKYVHYLVSEGMHASQAAKEARETFGLDKKPQQQPQQNYVPAPGGAGVFYEHPGNPPQPSSEDPNIRSAREHLKVVMSRDPDKTTTKDLSSIWKRWGT